ncbi:cupin domain-containing protein [Oscillospiraceae bacterium 50-16]|nr:cupin domain-containing protein [Lawsonibacter sp.]
MSELSYMKNIPGEEVLELAAMVEAGPGQVVSRTLAQNPAVSVTLFAFAKGEEISTHQSEGDAMVTVLEGTGKFTVDGVEHLVQKGEALVMPAGKPHAVYGQEAFKMLLVVVFP